MSTLLWEEARHFMCAREVSERLRQLCRDPVVVVVLLAQRLQMIVFLELLLLTASRPGELSVKPKASLDETMRWKVSSSVILLTRQLLFSMSSACRAPSPAYPMAPLQNAHPPPAQRRWQPPRHSHDIFCLSALPEPRLGPLVTPVQIQARDVGGSIASPDAQQSLAESQASPSPLRVDSPLHSYLRYSRCRHDQSPAALLHVKRKPSTMALASTRSRTPR